MNRWIDGIPPFIRRDPLTGAGNQLAFFEWLMTLSQAQTIEPFTLVSLDIIDLRQLNDEHGYAAGDAALRWAALVLEEEAKAGVFRIGGDEFVGILVEGTPIIHSKEFERVCHRLRKEASLVKLDPPAAFVAMIHYSGMENISAKDVLGMIYGSLVHLKQDPGHSNKIFNAGASEPLADLGNLVNDLARRLVSLGSMLDKSYQLAYIDSITKLPNMHAAMNELDLTFSHARAAGNSFVILLIDGDNLGKYNKLGYLAGDEMIERLGTVLKSEMRPSDFLARWRTGDEFLVILKDANPDQALPIAERLRLAVKNGSLDWVYSITISQGVACYPDQGRTPTELLQQAEKALILAKETGRDRVVLL